MRGGSGGGIGAEGWDPTEVKIEMANASCVHPSTDVCGVILVSCDTTCCGRQLNSLISEAAPFSWVLFCALFASDLLFCGAQIVFRAPAVPGFAFHTE